ncbi:MAG: hypothetical protein ACFCVG_09985 [Kineosporiaceae bacterium]
MSGDGRIRLPLHLWWSGDREFDPDDPVDRRRVYEIVLREGGEADVRRYTDRATLAADLDDLVLPVHVAQLWRDVLTDA